MADPVLFKQFVLTDKGTLVTIVDFSFVIH